MLVEELNLIHMIIVVHYTYLVVLVIIIEVVKHLVISYFTFTLARFSDNEM